MDLLKPAVAAFGVLLAGLLLALVAGALATRAELGEGADLLLVILPVAVAAFVAGGVAARVHAAPDRHRPGRHLLAATLVPLLMGAAGALGVRRGVDFEALARVGNLVVPVAAAAAGARLLDREKGTVGFARRRT